MRWAGAPLAPLKFKVLTRFMVINLGEIFKFVKVIFFVHCDKKIVFMQNVLWFKSGGINYGHVQSRG